MDVIRMEFVKIRCFSSQKLNAHVVQPHAVCKSIMQSCMVNMWKCDMLDLLS